MREAKTAHSCECAAPEEFRKGVYAAAGSLEDTTLPETDLAGSGTAIKIAIMTTNAASDIKLSTRNPSP